jgi:hypothetical protein
MTLLVMYTARSGAPPSLIAWPGRSSTLPVITMFSIGAAGPAAVVQVGPSWSIGAGVSPV